MNLKTVNDLFGYGFFGIGASKIIFTILLFMRMFTNVNVAFNGGYGGDYGYYPIFSVIIAWIQIIVTIGAVIMIFVNMKRQLELIPGYLLGIGATLLELITPSGIAIFVLFTECGMYMKAGNIIKKRNLESKYIHKTSKKMIKNTEWFYSEQSKQNEQNEQVNIKKQKRIEKLKKELEEWKQLLDIGEIDEETYNQETSKLIERETKKIENM